MNASPSARPPRWMFVAVPAAAALLGFALFEVALRFAVEPSPRAFGRLRGLDLPPVRIVPHAAPDDTPPDRPYENLVVDGAGITHGDLFGIKREHPGIGYVWQENRTSTNGWWRTNELGARADGPTPREVPAGRTRVAVFGDSFAAATRVPQQAAWTARLGGLRPDLDVVNFGVDGYSSAQTLLRFREVSEAIDFHVALFLFVPWHDPWRDVNVVRSIAEPWNSHTPMPRFVLEGDGLRLVPPLYDRVATAYARNHPDASPELLDHLRRHDRFFLEDLYAPPPVLGRLVTWKFLAARRAREEQRRIRMRIGEDVDGEAFEITRRIFAAAHSEGAARGRRVVVAVLPVHRDLTNFERSDAARARWDRILGSIRDAGGEIVDLAPALLAAPDDHDEGYDGTHYGPRANLRIAAALAAALR